jgi:hypothetical protein
MAKTKQKTLSAAQRREKQRQQRLAGSQNNQSQERNRRSVQRGSNRQRQWLLIGGVLVLIAFIIGAFIVISRQQSGGGTVSNDPAVFKAVTQVDPSVLATVATGGVQNPLNTVKGPPPLLKGPSGKPEFFYAGADYCPFCAAERWSIIVALSRFGTFGHLDQIQSAENSISTFTFYRGTYSSSYIDFVPIELHSNDVDSSGNYVVLQTPTADQQKILATYDAAPYTKGGIPFVSIANQYVFSGSSYDPQVLFDSSSQSLSWQNIARALSDASSPVAQNILGTANYLTAGICTVTQQQPGNVCNTDAIQRIERSLGKSAVASGGAQVAVAGRPEAVLRRQD